MCKPSIRQCPLCGFARAYAYTNCPTYLRIQETYVLRQKRTPLHPSECPRLKIKEADVWLLPYPAIQCGNKECSSQVDKEKVQQKRYQIAEYKARKEAERKRLEYEALKRKKDVFAKKWFRKIPVLSIEEQDEAWEARMDEKERMEREIIKRG